MRPIAIVEHVAEASIHASRASGSTIAQAQERLQTVDVVPVLLLRLPLAVIEKIEIRRTGAKLTGPRLIAQDILVALVKLELVPRISLEICLCSRLPGSSIGTRRIGVCLRPGATGCKERLKCVCGIAELRSCGLPALVKEI